jgi:hypothetical protein
VEVETAAKRYLEQELTVRGMVADRVYKRKLEEHVDKTGKRALVVRRDGGWTSPDRVQSSEYPVLAVDCWADNSRDAEGLKMGDDAEDNAWALYRVVDPLLHRIRSAWWGTGGSREGLRIIESTRWQEPWCQTKAESHGGVAYSVELGESAVVTARYAVWTAH